MSRVIFCLPFNAELKVNEAVRCTLMRRNRFVIDWKCAEMVNQLINPRTEEMISAVSESMGFVLG